VGVAAEVVTEALNALAGVVSESRMATIRLLWRRVQSQPDVSRHV
jgi:hypothetical protein